MARDKNAPRILALDIETAPALAMVFSARKPFITPKHIVQDSRMICFSAQWEGSRSVLFYSEHHDGRTAMLEAVAELLNEADIILHYNGDSFDVPWIKGELLTERIEQPSPFKSIDLYKAIRSSSRFMSNKLEFVAPKLMDESKVTHEGIEMWWKCLQGDQKAWNKMRQYAKHDTALMFPLYKRLLPIIKNHPDMNLYRADGLIGCRYCGSLHVQRRGVARTAAGVFQRYQCNDCRRYYRDNNRIGSTTTRSIT